MTDTTTISITEAQRDELAALKKHDRESYKAVIDRLLADGTAAADGPAVDAEELADAVAERLEGPKPLEDMAFEDWFEPDYAQTIARHVTAEIEFGEIELNDRLDRIESAAKEATNAAQSAEHAIENMGGR